MENIFLTKIYFAFFYRIIIFSNVFLIDIDHFIYRKKNQALL
jgi:hypothetical protein